MSNNKNKSAWLKYDAKGKKEIFNFCEGYKDYMSVCKTERESILEAIKLAEERGYKDLNEVIKNNEPLKAGDKVYLNNKDKALALFLIGEEALENGMRIIGSHVDSPRLDLKQNTLYEDGQLALMDTHYYGGVKKYQWVTLPLAIHGVIVKKDGTTVEINIGEEEDDPVFFISDLLIHLSAEQLEKKAAKVIEGEALDLIIGNVPSTKEEDKEEKEAVKKNMILKKKILHQQNWK